MRKHISWIIALLSVVLPLLQAEWHYRHPLPPETDLSVPLYTGR